MKFNKIIKMNQIYSKKINIVAQKPSEIYFIQG